MKKGIFVIYDNISKEVATVPLVSENPETITRNLQDAKLPDTMEKHPEDFDLYQIGIIDTAECEIFAVKELVCHLGAIKHGEK